MIKTGKKNKNKKKSTEKEKKRGGVGGRKRDQKWVNKERRARVCGGERERVRKTERKSVSPWGCSNTRPRLDERGREMDEGPEPIRQEPS